MRRPYIEFMKDGRSLCQYTMQGTFPGELKATRELLASENDCKVSDIDVFLRSTEGDRRLS